MTVKRQAIPGVNLYLVGFMGTGKTTLGRMVAADLGFTFVDSDAAIERERGRKIPEIFAEEGEAAFRRYEREFILSGHPPRRCVVACGGGLAAQEGMAELLKERGVVICLFASPETILERTRGNSTRPLLETGNPEERIRELMAAREAAYRRTGTLVLTDNRSRSELLAHIRRIYLREARVMDKRQGT